MNNKQPIPSVGLSYKADRIFKLLDSQQKKKGASELKSAIDIYIVAVGSKEFGGLLVERMTVARQLWDVGTRAEFAAKVKPKRCSNLIRPKAHY